MLFILITLQYKYKCCKLLDKFICANLCFDVHLYPHSFVHVHLSNDTVTSISIKFVKKKCITSTQLVFFLVSSTWWASYLCCDAHNAGNEHFLLFVLFWKKIFHDCSTLMYPYVVFSDMSILVAICFNGNVGNLPQRNILQYHIYTLEWDKSPSRL